MCTTPQKLVTNITSILILFIPSISVMLSCNIKNDNPAFHYPTEQYEYTSLDTSKAIIKNVVYVPIYSHMYMVNGTRPTNFAATLSIRIVVQISPIVFL